MGADGSCSRVASGPRTQSISAETPDPALARRDVQGQWRSPLCWARVFCWPEDEAVAAAIPAPTVAAPAPAWSLGLLAPCS